MDKAKVQLPENFREEVLLELKGTELDMQLALKALRANSPIRARILRCEQYVVRQSQAMNPDSVLSQRLLECQREFFKFFAKYPGNLPLYQRINQGDPSVWIGSLYRRNLSRRHFPHLLSMRRVTMALWLNHLVLLRRTHTDLAQPALLAARGLQETLDADPKQPQRLAGAAPSTSLASDSDLPFHLKVRCQHGYKPLPGQPNEGVSFVVHSAGALFIGKPGQPFDIDLTLVNANPDTFPKPRSAAKVLSAGAGVRRLFYTDRKGRAREVGYDKRSDGYVFIE